MNQSRDSYILILLALFISFAVIAGGITGCDDSEDDDESAEKSDSGKGNGSDDAGSASEDTGVDIDEVTDEHKADVCQCVLDIGDLPDESLIEDCEENIADDCVKCVLGIKGEDSCEGDNADDYDPCANDCKFTISPPETVDECKTMIELDESNPTPVEKTDCLCENCLDDRFGECLVTPLCLDILICAQVNDCLNVECTEPCAEEIDAAAVDNSVIATVLAIEACLVDNECPGSE